MMSSIYRPEVPGGELSRPKCGGRVGPKEIVTFAAGAVKVRMSAHSGSDGRVRVSVAYLVPSDVRLRLAVDEFVVTGRSDGRTQRYRVGRLTRSTVEGRWEEVAAESEPIGRDVGPPGQRSPAPIFGAFTTEAPLPGVFEVQLPRALVDGAATDFPKVLFRQAEEAWISPFNC